MRSRLKALLGAASSSRPLRPLVTRRLRARTNVVYYHFVGPPTPYYASFYAGCTFERFRRDIEELARVFRFASLEEVCEEPLATEPKYGRPSLALTFDDGFKINARVLELLDRHGIKATTFVTTGCVGNQSLMWRNKLSAILHLAPRDLVVSAYNSIAARFQLSKIKSHTEMLGASRQWSMSAKDDLAGQLWVACSLPPIDEFLAEYEPYFTWDELGEWQRAGHAIGLHSVTHPFCSRLDDREVSREIVEPAGELRSRFDLAFLPFSYPFGDRVSPERERALLEAGVFDCAFGIAGFARKNTAPQSLERAGLEAEGVAWPVFGRTLVAPI